MEKEKSRQLELLEALYARAQVMSESLDQMAVAGQGARTSVEVLGAGMAWLGRAEEDGSVSLLSGFPYEHPYPASITVRFDDTPEGQGPTGRAIRSGLPQISNDVLTDPTFAPWRPVAEKYGFRSTAALPLISRGRTFGALNLYSDRPGFFSAEHPQIFQTFAHQVASALENARLFEQNTRQLTRLGALRKIDMAITGSLDLRVIYMVALDEIVSRLVVDAAAILRMNARTRQLQYAAGRGFRTADAERFRVPLGKGCTGRAALERRVMHIPDLSEAGAEFPEAELSAKEAFSGYYAAPLVAKGKLLGVLGVFQRTSRRENREWLEFLESLAGQVAIAIDNAALFSDLERKNRELLQAYEATIEGWARALALKEEETEEHSQRLVELTTEMARAMGMSDDDLVHLRRGTLLHDIGKIGIPDSILLKPGKLTEAERFIMRQHPVYAFEMLSPIMYLHRAIDIPYAHHERWDGTGYPRGLQGEQIPVAARIFRVVDVWDALTRNRPYRKAWSEKRALAYIRSQSGRIFDPKAVAVFSEIIESRGKKQPA